MKKILYFLGLAMMLSGMLYSCKEDSLEVMRDKEVAALNKYVKDNNLEAYKDPSGIYFKLDGEHKSTDTIKTGWKVMLHYNITLIDDTTVVLSTEDEYGHNFEEDAFWVDLNNTSDGASPLQKIAGMHIALKKMHIGDRAFVVIPSELAFKAVDIKPGARVIPRFSTLLVSVYARRGYAPE